MRSAIALNLGVIEIEVAVRDVKGMELLLGKRHARRKRRHVPVDMCDAIVRSKAEHIEPVCRERIHNRSSEPVDAPLQRDVFLFGEVTDDRGSMRDRCEKHTPEERRILRKERDTKVIGEDEMFCRRFLYEITNETLATPAICDQITRVFVRVDPETRLLLAIHIRRMPVIERSCE